MGRQKSQPFLRQNSSSKSACLLRQRLGRVRHRVPELPFPFSLWAHCRFGQCLVRLAQDGTSKSSDPENPHVPGKWDRDVLLWLRVFCLTSDSIPQLQFRNP